MGIAVCLCAIYAGTEATDTLMLYLISAQSLGSRWLRRMYAVGILTFTSVIIGMSIVVTHQHPIVQPFIIWQSKGIATVFIVKDLVFLTQALIVGIHAYAHNGWTRTSIFQYLFLMAPLRLLLVIGRSIYACNGVDGGICIIEVS